MSQLIIKNLHVEVENREILKGIDLVINAGETHALMGPNGNGKSTLLGAIMGNPKYKITEGSVFLDSVDVLALPVDERAKAGLFLGMQYPSEVAGVTNSDFLRAAMNARLEKPVSLFKFIKEMEGNIKKMEMKPDLAHRFLNEGFSGGEKKRNEIVQMLMLKPTIAMLDEIDSGLDVDALKIVANAVKEMQEQNNIGLMIVSHYERFYQLLQPSHAHVLINGKIVKSGDISLVMKIDEEGYDWLSKELDIEIKKEEVAKPVILGSCGAQQKGN